MGHVDHPIRLPESLTDGEIILDGHVVADAEAHLRDEEMLLRFDRYARADTGSNQTVDRRTRGWRSHVRLRPSSAITIADGRL